MTKSESKFRIWAKKKWPNAYIKKLPDFKQSGSKALGGLPDYLIINNGIFYWFEVKMIKGITISLEKDFTPAQIMEFPKIIAAGLNIFVFIFYKKTYSIISYNILRDRQSYNLETQTDLEWFT